MINIINNVGPKYSSNADQLDLVKDELDLDDIKN
jgi:hypothetical protein